MMEIETGSLDGRYEGHRLKDRAAEIRLFGVIAERGIVEPLEGVDESGRHILLNGFKRWRCAQKLGLASVPYQSLGEDAGLGIVALLRASNDRALGLLEQAGFVDELKSQHGLGVAEIATALTRSKAWVSLRLGLMAELPSGVRQSLFSGGFPTYAYMYSVRPFMRINGVGRDDVERFVVALSGKGLSVREIEYLTRGYFRGPEALREQFGSGNVALPLEQLKLASAPSGGGTLFEQTMLKDMELAQKYLQRVGGKCHDSRLKSAAFRAQAHLLLGGLLSRVPVFLESVRELHDRCGQT